MKHLLCILLLLPLATMGCREEGPAERAGRAVDEAVDDAADTIGEGLEDAGRNLQERR